MPSFFLMVLGLMCIILKIKNKNLCIMAYSPKLWKALLYLKCWKYFAKYQIIPSFFCCQCALLFLEFILEFPKFIYGTSLSIYQAHTLNCSRILKEHTLSLYVCKK